MSWPDSAQTALGRRLALAGETLLAPATSYSEYTCDLTQNLQPITVVLTVTWALLGIIHHIYPRRPTLTVRLSVCPQHNSKANDPKVFKLGIGMTLGYARNDMVLWLKGQRSRARGH